MDIKNIEKISELRGFKWGKRNRIKENRGSSMNSLVFERFTKSVNGESRWIDMFNVSKNNLDELEYFGLKVILNEKPKLSREDKEFLTQDQYLARDENGILWLYHQKPTKTAGFWECANGGKNIGFSTGINHLFPFITWESGKAWSKSELMELEVVE